MQENQKQKRYPCSFCWQDSNGTLEVESVQGFSLSSGGGHWFACEKHLDHPLLQGEKE